MAIGVFDSPNTQVLHNSVILSGTYPNAVEYRFAGAAGVLIANNLFNAAIAARDGASATLSGNDTTATTALFVSPAAGDLHLRAGASVAIDKVSLWPNCTTDWDGANRPSGAASDIGADELRSAPRPPVNVRIVR